MNARIKKTASGRSPHGGLGKTSMSAKTCKFVEVEKLGAAKMKRDVRAKKVFAALFSRARVALVALASLSAVAAISEPASAQNANPYQFKKEAFKPDGTPWTGPVKAGDIIKYVLSYKPGTTNSGPVTIVDTLSPNQSYVPPTKASDSRWTWGSSPYSSGNTETYSHPGFGPGTGTVKVTVTGVPAPVAGVGDGTIPVPILSLNKVFGVFHHANTAALAKVDCWDLTTLAKCGSAQPNATSGFITTPLTPQSVVRGTKLYFLGYLAGGVATIGCYDGAAQAACADSPLPASVTDMGALAGLVEDNTGRVFAAVNDRVFCRVLPAATNCAGWPAAGIVSVTGAISPSYATANVLYVSMEHGPSPTRLYVHHSNARMQCIDINSAGLCAGSWTSAGTKIAAINKGEMLSSFPSSGSSGDGGVCLWQVAQIGCLSTTGAPISVTPTAVTGRAISSFRLPNSGKVFFPAHYNVGGPKCVDYSGTTGGPCAGYVPPWPVPQGTQYGFALDPSDPAKCMLALGHDNLLWRFDYHTGKIGCGKAVVVTPKLEDLYCNGTPTLATFRWTTIRVRTTGAAGTLTITKGTGTPVNQTITSGTTTYSMPGGIGPGYGQLSFSYTPISGSPTTVDFEIDYVSDKNPQICYQAVVKTCGSPVFNEAVFTGRFNGAPVKVSQRVDLGKATGPDCPELTSCLQDSKVNVKCNGDGTYTLTLSGSGFTGTDITMTSQTPGVTVSPPQQPWSATTTWTISGATSGQAVTLYANGTKIGGGGEPGTDQCCSGEIKIVTPDCNPKPPIDVKVEKENTPAGGQGNGFNVWVTNVGAPITFAPGELTVKDVIPAGLTIFTQSSPNWTCIPLPATGPATINCTYNLAGSLGTGAQLTDSLVFAGLITNHEQALKNCAIVSIPARVGVDTNPANDQACVDIKDDKVGRLIFTKHAVYVGPITLPAQTYTVNVLCGTTTTTLNLVNNVPQTIGNIPYGTSCSYTETTPAVPPGVCPANRIGVWTTAFVPPPSVTINAPVTNVAVNNTLTCQPGGDGVLRVQKQVNQNGYEFNVSSLTFPATATCGGTNYPLTLSILAPVTVGSLPLGTNCSVTENVSSLPIPPDTCAAGSTGSWLATTAPASVTIGTTPTTIVVVNTLICSPNQSTTDVGINKTGGTTPVQQPYYVFDMTVTNHGSAISTVGAVVVTETVPANMTFNTIGGSGWVCVPPGGPAGTVIKCTYNGSVAAGQVLPVIHVDATATGGAPYPPVTNCALIGFATTSGLTDMNPANNNACVTVTKPNTCTPPQVANNQGICVNPPPACLPPMVPGAVPGQCICPPGTMLRGRECVKVTTCQPPMVPGPVAGQCICGPGYVQRGNECVKTIVCRPPLVPNPAGTNCVCRPGLVLRQGKCVEPIVCREPATLNRAGTACLCPQGWVKKGNSCERERPRITPNDVIRNIPGIFPGGGGRDRRPSGSSDGGRGTPGVR